MTTPKQIRVMLADDHPIMRDDLRYALQDEGDFEVVGLARDGVEAVRMVQSLAPEVIVMDVMLPHKGGVDACREIMQLRPDARVLMLTASTTPPPQRMRSSRQSPPERRATCRRTRGLRSRRRRSGMWPWAFCAFRAGPSGGSSPWSAASGGSPPTGPWTG